MSNVNPLWRIEGFSPRFHVPWIAVGLRIFRVILVWIDPYDLSILALHFTQRTALRPHKAEADQPFIFVCFLLFHDDSPIRLIIRLIACFKAFFICRFRLFDQCRCNGPDHTDGCYAA